MGKHGKSIKKVVKQHNEQNYVVTFNIPIHRDLYDVVNVLLYNSKYSAATKNNIWLAVAYVDKRLKNRSGFVPIRLKDIREASNNLSPKTIRETLNDIKKYFKYHLFNGSSFEINWKYSYEERKSRSYKFVANRDKEYEYLTLEMKKNSVSAWRIGSQQYYLKKLEGIKDYDFQYLMFEEKEEDKVNAYKDIEKDFRGYHQGKDEIERIIEDRFKNNVYIKIDYLRRQVYKMFKDKRIDVSIGEQLNKIIEAAGNKTFTYSHGRIYCNGFHNCSKEYRDKIWYFDEDKLVELFDVKSCFWLFSFLLYSKEAKRDIEWGNLYDLIINGDLYVKVQNTLQLESRDEAKQMLIKWLFSNKNDKKYRRSINGFFKKNFPNFYEWLISRIQVVDDNGDKKNTLSVECQWLENSLMKELFENVKEMNTVTLHDSIWISEKQKTKQLEDKIQNEWKQIIKRQLDNKEVDKWNTFIDMCLKDLNLI